MPRNEHYIRVMTEMDVSRAVVQTKRCAEACGFADDMATMIATAASELARNILKYASNGEVIIRPVEDQTREGLQIEARDRGPGIMDIESALRDHVSDAGTLGLGLPGVRRMMDDFEISSFIGKGTTVIATKWL